MSRLDAPLINDADLDATQGGEYHEAASLTGSQTPFSRKKWVGVLSLMAVACVVGVVAFTSNSSSGAGDSSQTRRVTQPRSSSSDLPDPAPIYNTPGCPFSHWFNNLPERFGIWEQNLINAYEDEWALHCDDAELARTDPAAAGCPQGYDENDHNYNTKLGQGNTLGFLAGHFMVSEDIPESLQTGVLAKAGATLPVVGRYSDFGDDAAALRLGRIALKIPVDEQNPSDAKPVCDGDDPRMTAGSWYGEFNMLFTETLDAFPLADFNAVQGFAQDASSSTWEKFTQGVDFAALLARSAFRLARDNKKPVNAKEYFSQLPYRLGCTKAAKWHLQPRVQSCGWFSKPECCVPDVSDGTKSADVSAMYDHTRKCDTIYDVHVQIKDIDDAVVHNDAAAYWSEEYINVGTLVFPPQLVSQDTASSQVLSAAIGETLGLDEVDGAHKLFMFHPLLNPSEHVPLGEVNTFRSHFYSQHAESRLSTIQHDIRENSHPTPPHKMPFGQFKGRFAEELNELFGQ